MDLIVRAYLKMNKGFIYNTDGSGGKANGSGTLGSLPCGWMDGNGTGQGVFHTKLGGSFGDLHGNGLKLTPRW